MLYFRRALSTLIRTTRTYNDAIEALNSLQTNYATIEAIRKAGGKSPTDAIPQMLEWARRVGYKDPAEFNRLNIIHVTGTKGKGSTCAFVQSILSQYSEIQKIGLYTSPHLKSVRERIRLNGKPIEESKFARYFFEVWDRLEATTSPLNRFPEMGPGVKPGYFRFLTLLSFHVFMSENVDAAIYEVGVGGEYDSTNIVVSPVVTGISSLGLDHTNILGKTIEEIAWNKAGIFKKNVPALTVGQPPNAINVLQNRAKEKGTELRVVGSFPELSTVKLGLRGSFQSINASLAIELANRYLVSRGIKNILNLDEKFARGLEQSSWFGRCQTIEDGNVTWLLDGAHTNESIQEASKWYCEVSTPKKNKILLFNQQIRDANALIHTLRDIISHCNEKFDHVIFTTNITWSSGQYSADLTSINTSRVEVDGLRVQTALSHEWEKMDETCNRHIFASIEDSVKFIRSLEGNSQVLVTGSLHLVGGLLTVLNFPI